MRGDNLLIVTTSSSERELLSTALRASVWRLLYAEGVEEAASILRALPVSLVVASGVHESEWPTLTQAARTTPSGSALVRVVDAVDAASRPFVDGWHQSDAPVMTTAAAVRQSVERTLNARRTPAMPERRAGDARPRSRRFIGVSAKLHGVLRAVQRVPSESNVLVLGESGTGKELVARMIADAARGPRAPFVSVGCGALGHRFGARTLFGVPGGPPPNGALARAAGGTLLLDELGDLPLVLQEALSPLVPMVPVRFIATSCRTLPELQDRSVMRQDLLAMVARTVIELPPLRERLEDIEPLAEFFAARQATEARRPAPTLTPAALRRLLAHDWPGNVRELQHAIARAVIHGDGETIEEQHLSLGTLSLPALRAAEDRRTKALAASAG